MGCGALLSLLAACGGGPAPTPRSVPEAVGSERSAALAATPVHAGPRDDGVTDNDLDLLWQRQMMLPVDGVARSQLQDTYLAGRSNGRTHKALDILAPRSTPVLAAVDLVIGRLYRSELGGNVIYAHDPDGRFVYYYAHLERYRRGLAVGDLVARGGVIGYVGTTGNAPSNTPHLHFQVMKRGDGRTWWDGPPINPFSYFASDGTRS